MTAPLRNPAEWIVGRGRRTPQELLSIDERNHLIRKIAARCCCGLSDRASAEWVHAKLSRYFAGRWRRDMAQSLCPLRHRGTVTELLWLTLKSRDRVPSVSSIRAALKRPRGIR